MSTDHRTWTQALELLERDLEDALRLLASGVDAVPDCDTFAWRPPVVHGPIPDDLVDRARHLAARQQAVVAELQRATATAKADLEGAPYPHASQPMGTPAYFDVSA